MCDCLQNGITNCSCADNCPTRTSDILTFDGAFANISVPDGSSLNDVLTLMETYFYNLYANNANTTYTLVSDSACLGLSAGTYSHSQMLDAIVAVLCQNQADILQLQTDVAAIVANPNTTDVTLDGIVLPACFSAFAGTTSTDLFNEILTSLCDLENLVGPTTGGTVTPTAPDPGQVVDPDTPNYSVKGQLANYGSLSEVIASLADNNGFIYDHTAPTTSATSFTTNLKAMKGVVEDYLVIRTDAEDFTVNATKDTYFYLSADGTILKREVAVAAPAPATPTASHPLYKMESDGSGIVGVTNLYTDTAFTPLVLGTDDVTTPTIKDGAVTVAKLANVGAGAATYGDASLFQMRTNDKGQVDLVTANASFAGIADGDILVYNLGLSRFEVQANTFIAASNRFPKANAAATDYEDSSLLETTNQIESDKKVEINAGVKVDDSEAILNLVSTTQYFLPPRMTHTQAGALTLTDGALIYVTSTDATFTSVGFWGVESGAWVKL